MNSLPFPTSRQLCSDLDTDVQGSDVVLPGQPCLLLNDSIALVAFLEKDLLSEELEKTSSRLWVMSTQSSSNINALHHQKIKGREIIVTEQARLHLIWIHDRVFIKPLPKYLLSRTFWERFLSDESTQLGHRRDSMRRAALGYLRTYRHLIQHESDFTIAKQDHLRLVPQNVTWNDFCQFMSEFHGVADENVSGRYRYGELRLSRLNFYAPILFRKAYYEQIHGQYGDYFGRLYGPILFVFAVVTTVLNSMQVELAVEEVLPARWVALWPVCRWFSTIGLILTALVSVWFLLLWLWLILDEWVFAIRSRLRKRRLGYN